MNYFEGEKIFVEVPSTTTKISEKYDVVLKIAGEYGYVDDASIIINQQKGTNEKTIKMKYVDTENDINVFKSTIQFENIGVHYFCIRVILNGTEKWIKNDTKNKCACITTEGKPYWTITVYEDGFRVPDWAKGKIMYQIFPDRFYKSEKYTHALLADRVTKKWGEEPNWENNENGDICNNDYFMGNLKGIEEKLDYISELGAEIIYLNPICLSQSNHRYDVADYEKVDPYLGTNESLRDLCNKAHKRGMKIIIDAVFNHTGNDSKYFNEFGTFRTIGASQGPKSPYYDWYKKNENGDFTYWWGFKNLPVCDGNNAGWQSFIYGKGGIIDKWFSFGIDGIRLDVADELTDEFIENIRKAVKRNKPDGFILGEVWDNAITKEGYGKQRTYLLGKGLDSVMNYPFANAILKYVRYGKVDYFVETLEDIVTEYPEEALNSLMNSISTHDIPRAMSTLVAEGMQNNKYNWVWDVPYSRSLQHSKEKLSEEDYNKAKKLMKIATTIQYFLPGNPCIYYGDEVGMYGYKDPFNRRCLPWNCIDNELHEFFIKLGKTRKSLDFLATSKIRIISINEKTLIFERASFEKEKVLVAINRSEDDIELDIPLEYKNAKTIFDINSQDNILKKYGILIKYIN